jgi:hypothetical protein
LYIRVQQLKASFVCAQNIAALIGSQWFQTVSSFSSEKLEAKKCTGMYIF